MTEKLSAAEYIRKSEEVQLLIAENRVAEEQVLDTLNALGSRSDIDKRWLSIARTDIERGFMALNRALAEPLMNMLSEVEL
ncbi:Acb2/Tad1 domain-containing protein [Rhizobium lusitanum]|uniref:Acb2/Tad1 hairpin domain-containing protein n=1 Tax=Rhizobium lusitanum TaxID=293958 RepID=A0A1C3USL4_9HYPH|nr:hypothetical protein [Rhizobium lusitanum]SCB18483.1 hypothetical protein GA0061101_103268 [Rhizobium lusitanum]